MYFDRANGVIEHHVSVVFFIKIEINNPVRSKATDGIEMMLLTHLLKSSFSGSSFPLTKTIFSVAFAGPLTLSVMDLEHVTSLVPQGTFWVGTKREQYGTVSRELTAHLNVDLESPRILVDPALG